MSQSIICHGCGQPVALPDGYRRNKIQCPACGVIAPVTEAAKRTDAPAPKAAARRDRPEVDEDAWAADFLTRTEVPPAGPRLADEPELHLDLREDPDRGPETTDLPRPQAPPRALPDDLKPLPPPKSERRRPKEEGKASFSCRRCGRLIRRQGECPTCDAVPPEPGADEVPDLSLDDPDDDPAEGSPYVLDGASDVKCPKCTNMLPPESTFCTRCGYDFRRRKKKRKTFEPLERTWEPNHSLQRRKKLFIIFQVVTFAAALVVRWAMDLEDWGPFVFSILGFAAMTSFLMGTFDRIDLTRNDKGKVMLKRLRRICFYPMYVEQTEVQGFEGVSLASSYEAGIFEWLVFFMLLPYGIVSGLVWWYYAIHKVTFRVALTRDHGYAAVVVCQGWDEAQMRDVANTIAGAAGLQFDGK